MDLQMVRKKNDIDLESIISDTKKYLIQGTKEKIFNWYINPFTWSLNLSLSINKDFFRTIIITNKGEVFYMSNDGLTEQKVSVYKDINLYNNIIKASNKSKKELIIDFHDYIKSKVENNLIVNKQQGVGL